MKVRTILRVGLLLIVLVAVIVAALQIDAVSLFGRQVLSSLGIAESRRIESSRIVLEEVRDIYELSTIEYVYRVVFPHDFMAPDVSIASIMQTLRSAQGRIETLLSPDELEYYQAYTLSDELGLAVGDGQYEFLVVTVVVGAGYDLSGTPLAGTVSDDAVTDLVTITEERRDGAVHRSIVIPLPEPSITHVIIEDRDTESYPYPDVSIQPDGWRRIAGFVSTRIGERTVEEGILTEASERGRNVIRSLLLEAGYDEVQFRPVATRTGEGEQ